MATTPVANAYNSPVNFYIPQSPPDGIQDPIAANAIREVYNAMQNIIQTLVNYCGIGPQSSQNWAALAGSPNTLLSGNLNRLYVIASEAIAFGAFINLFSNAGVLNARNANATNNTKPADGVCTTSAGIAIGTAGEVQLGHCVSNLAGVTVGTRYYLSTVNGLPTAVAPVAAGNIEQYLGVGIDTVTIFVNLGYWIQH